MVESDGTQLYDMHTCRMTEFWKCQIAVVAFRRVVVVLAVSMRVLMIRMKIGAMTVTAMHQYMALTVSYMSMQRAKRRQN